MEEKTEKNILKMKLIFSLEKLLEKSDFIFTIDGQLFCTISIRWHFTSFSLFYFFLAKLNFKF